MIIMESGRARALALAGYVVNCFIAYAISHYIAHKAQPSRPKNTDVVADADLIFSVPAYTWLTYLAIMGTSELWDEDYKGHWFGKTDDCVQFAMLYVSVNFVHIFITIAKDQKLDYKILMCLHHALSITCMSAGLYNDRMYFFGVLDGICEFSTLMLTTLFIFKDGLAGQSTLIGHLLVVNGLFLWLSYLVCRLVLFPVWLYIYISEATQHYDETFAVVTPIEKYLYPFANVFLLFLSAHWFKHITKGMLKQLNKNKVKTKNNNLKKVD